MHSRSAFPASSPGKSSRARFRLHAAYGHPTWCNDMLTASASRQHKRHQQTGNSSHFRALRSRRASIH